MITHFLRICIILICVFCLSGAGVGHVSGTEVGPIGILFLSLATLITLIMMGLYAGSETALVSVDKGFIDKSATEGNERAKIVRMLTGSHDRMLGMTLVGTNIMHVATSQLGLILVLTIISYSEQTRTFLNNLANITTISVKSVLLTVGFNTDFKWQISLAWVATIITTFLILVFAEILPKTLFRNQANSLALQYAHYLRISDLLFRPIVIAVTQLPRLLTQHIGQSQQNANVRRDELRLVATIGEHSGTIGSEQRRMIHDALDFQRQRVEEIMVPLVEIVAVKAGTNVSDFLTIASESGYSRIPVYQDRIFNIVGIAHVLDIIYAMTQYTTEDSSADDNKTVDELMNYDLKYVPESKPIHALLQDLKASPHTMAFVVNEYGGIVGLVTVEDLVEEIVGEFADERDNDHQIRQIGPNMIECGGRTEVDKLNEMFNLGVPTGDYETIAGYVLELEKRLPEIGLKLRTNRLV